MQIELRKQADFRGWDAFPTLSYKLKLVTLFSIWETMRRSIAVNEYMQMKKLV